MDGLIVHGTSAATGWLLGTVLANLIWWLKYE